MLLPTAVFTQVTLGDAPSTCKIDPGSLVPMPTLPELVMRIFSVNVIAPVFIVEKRNDVGNDDVEKLPSAYAEIEALDVIYRLLVVPEKFNAPKRSPFIVAVPPT